MKKIIFTVPARADPRRIDRDTAMRILTTLHRFAETGEGDIKKLQGESMELRLRVCDYRVRFAGGTARHSARLLCTTQIGSLPLRCLLRAL